MYFRSAGIIATLLIGLEGPGCQAFAQYYSPQLYPPPRAYPAPPGPPIDADNDPHETAALPPDVRPEAGPKKELPPQFRRTLVDYYTKEPAGTIIIDTSNTYLYVVLGSGRALRYGIGVGREGIHLGRRGTDFQNGGMARLESAGNNDRAPALSASLHGRR
jgi:lipoprotein-anchoring transpeptidase ErfK/SrfK